MPTNFQDCMRAARGFPPLKTVASSASSTPPAAGHSILTYKYAAPLAFQSSSILASLPLKTSTSLLIPTQFVRSISLQVKKMSTVSRAYLDQKLALAKRCSREAAFAGAKAAAIATVASAVPTLASVRMLPWAKANLNPAGQALIVCTAAGMAYFVAADKTILSLARKHSFDGAPDHLKDTSFRHHITSSSAPRPA